MTIFENNIRFEQSFEKNVAQFPDAIALCEWTGDSWQAISYQALFQSAQIFSHQLNQSDIRPGERIILSSHNRIGLVAALLGVWLSRATAVLIDPDLPDLIWKQHCDKADARIIVVEKERLQSAENNPAFQWIIEIENEKNGWHEKKSLLSHTVFNDCNEDIATLIFTSGTTSEYRAVILKHDHYHYVSQFYDDFLPQNSCALTVLPLFHIAGLFCGVLKPLLLGIRIVFIRSFSANALQEAFLQYHPEIVFGVPRLLEVLHQKIQTAAAEKNIFLRSFFYFLIRINYFLNRYVDINIGKICFPFVYEKFGNRLKKILCGSATLSPSLQTFFLALGFDLLCAYGLTETCGPIALSTKKYRWKIGNVGPCLEKKDLRIAASGEILYCGKALMTAYFRNDTATQQVIKNGCFHTGDLGRLDRFGNLYIMGRIKELIVFSDGKKATPEQIEHEYKNIAGIQSCAVFGVVKEGRAKAILALVPQEKKNIESIIAAIFKTASRLKTPYRISDVLAVDQIPRSNTFKIKRHELIALYLSKQENKSSPAVFSENDDDLHIMLTCFQNNLPDIKNHITLDSTFAELNIDSLQAAQLAQLMSQKLRISVNPTVFWFTQSIRELYCYLRQENRIVTASHEKKSKNKYEKIAVIAMDAVFPGAADTDTFWKNCLSGKDVITEIPLSRFNIDEYYDPYPLAPGKTNSRFGGFVNLCDDFPAEQFRLKSRAVAWMDPQQKMVLMQTARMLKPFSEKSFMQKNAEEKMGLYLGVGFPDYMIQSIKEIPVEKINSYSGIGMADFSMAGRVAYHFGFEGPAMIIKTACSSSLVAVHQAVRALQCGDCDVAIAGGVNLMLIPEINVCLTKGGFLSCDGRCKTFDASADGYVRSEGCGLVLLKRYDDAIAAGDPILATIIGSAVNQDGTSNGLTAPSGQAQIACYESALKNAGIAANEVGYIEAHGSGTQLGDAIEMQSIQSIYDKARDDPLYVGAVKSLIGHCESAAGIAGLIKTIAVLNDQLIPPNLHYHTPNPAISFEKSAIYLPTEKINFQKMCRYAAVSSFGVTGTNAHVIVEK